MDSTYIIDVMKAQELYAEADDLPWSERREKLELLKQADKACKAALKKSPEALDALMLSARVLVQMAGWQVDHPQASKRYFQRGLDRFRDAAEAHPHEEEPYLLWQALLSTAFHYVEVEPTEIRDMALDCAKWCERVAVEGNRSPYLPELWQGAALEFEQLIADEEDPDGRRHLEALEMRRRIAEVFAEMPEVLEEEAAAITRIAQSVADRMPERGREACEFVYGLGEQIEELDPQRSAAARTIEAEALMALALSAHVDSDEAFALWMRAEEKMQAAREELAEARDADGRPGRDETLLMREFATDTLTLTRSLAAEGHARIERLLTTALELLREVPPVLGDEEIRSRLNLVHYLMSTAATLSDVDLELMERTFQEALALIDRLDPQEASEGGVLHARATILHTMSRALASTSPDRAREYATGAADNYAAYDDAVGLFTPDDLMEWARAAALGAQLAHEDGDVRRAVQYYSAAAEALRRIDEVEPLHGPDLETLMTCQFHAIQGRERLGFDDTTDGEGEGGWRSGVDLICRVIAECHEADVIPDFVIMGLTLTIAQPPDDVADAMNDMAAAFNAAPAERKTPRYVEAILNARTDDVGAVFKHLEAALMTREIDWSRVAGDSFWGNVRKDDRWAQLEARYGTDGNVSADTESTSTSPVQLPLGFDDMTVDRDGEV
ncbi:MAG: hypothetical protein R6V07_06620 [Armatimonadota bacterium]